MTRVEMKPFCFEHLDLFAWRDDDLKTYGIRSELVDALTTAAEKGECWTAVYDGRILVIGGVIPHTKKTGYCFTIFSRYVDQDKKASIMAAKSVRQMFFGILDDLGLHRVVTYNREDASRQHRWCDWLGFTLETPDPIQKFDDEGNNYYQYALVR